MGELLFRFSKTLVLCSKVFLFLAMIKSKFFRSEFKFDNISVNIWVSVCRFFLPSFQLLICNAIRIPITTSTISPMAYLKYFPVLPFESKSYLIFRKNFIIVYFRESGNLIDDYSARVGECATTYMKISSLSYGFVARMRF